MDHAAVDWTVIARFHHQKVNKYVQYMTADNPQSILNQYNISQLSSELKESGPADIINQG